MWPPALPLSAQQAVSSRRLHLHYAVVHGADRRQFLLTKRAVYSFVATNLSEDRGDDRVRAHTCEVKMAAHREACIRIDFPLTISVQWFRLPLKNIGKTVEPEQFFVSGFGLLQQSAQWHVAQQREITRTHQFGVGLAAQA